MPYAPKRGGGGARGRGGSGSNTRFTGKRGGSFRSSSSRGKSSKVAYGIDWPAPNREDDGTAAAEKFEEVKIQDEIDEKLGFWRFESNAAAGEKKVGWLVNMHQVRRSSPSSWPEHRSGADIGRHSYSRPHIRAAWQLWTSTSSRMMEGCSRRRCRTSRTSTSLVE